MLTLLVVRNQQQVSLQLLPLETVDQALQAENTLPPDHLVIAETDLHPQVESKTDLEHQRNQNTENPDQGQGQNLADQGQNPDLEGRGQNLEGQGHIQGQDHAQGHPGGNTKEKSPKHHLVLMHVQEGQDHQEEEKEDLNPDHVHRSKVKRNLVEGLDLGQYQGKNQRNLAQDLHM